MKFKFGRYEKINQNYTWWLNFIQSKNKNKINLSANTYIELDKDNLLRFYYHYTNILTLSYLNRWQYKTSGWKSYTTKKRIYQLSPLNLWQCNYTWFYNDDQMNTQYFIEGMILDNNNRCVFSLTKN